MSTDPIARRRWFRFSLRTLLVFTVLVGLLMGWIAKERRQSQFERQLASELQKQGWNRDIIFGGPYDSWQLRMSGKPQGWWRDLARHVLGERLRSVGGSGREVSQLKLLAGLPSLDSLMINSQVVDDLTPLADMTTLHELYVAHTSVRDLTPIAGLANLKWLSLAGSPVSDLTPLAQLKELEWLCLLDTPVSDVRPIARLENLQSLQLDGTRVSDLAPLTGLTKLTDIGLQQTYNVSQEEIKELQQALPKCTIQHDIAP